MLLEPLFLDVVEAGPGDDREGYEGDADVVVGDGPQRVVVLLARRVPLRRKPPAAKAMRPHISRSMPQGRRGLERGAQFAA